jgi:hypothetical protein
MIDQGVPTHRAKQKERFGLPQWFLMQFAIYGGSCRSCVVQGPSSAPSRHERR